MGRADASLKTGLVADGVGDDPAPTLALAPLIPTSDTVPDTITGTNPVITVGGPHIISTIDTAGDQDFYKVELQGGVKYNIGMYGHPGGPSGVPQPDAYIELYDAAGNLIAYEDGKGRTPSGELYGLDAMLTINVATSGTYYINARAFEQDLDTDSTTTGDTVGDYDLFVEVNTDPAEPVDDQYYPMTSPLRAIDWGTQVDGTVRNPDGNEGTVNTGNPAGTPDAKGATVGYWGQSTDGKNVIKIYFAKPGDAYAPEDPSQPGAPPVIVAVGAKDYEITAIWISLREFEKVADVVYVETQNRDEADFHYVTYSGTPGTGGTPSLLGSMNPPQESDEGLAQFNSGDYRWNATNLQQGGFSFVTLIHEFGHGHGLAHAHDTGGNSTRMPGVKAIINTPAGPVPEPTNNYPNYTRGDFDLNQGVFTMMSYQDGWETSPYGRAPTDVGYGYLGGLMALDIAVIQSKYGVNEEWATGDDIYVLKDENAAGTFYSSIWDGGGIDEIRYAGARDSNIDLRAATLKYEIGGGGWVSYAWGIHGGYTIANGVTIENATTGSGNDSLRGNSVNNILDGGAGNDLFLLQDGGDDRAAGGSGNDAFYFGSAFTGTDHADGGEGRDVVILQGNYALTLSAANWAGIESISLQSGARTTWGDAANNFYDYDITMNDANVTGGQQLIVNGQSLRAGEDFTFDGSAETGDGKYLVYGGHGVDDLTGGTGNDVFFFEGVRWGGSDRVDGGAGRDAVIISGGNGLTRIEFSETSLTSIESISLNARFASDPTARPSYELVLANGNVAAGATLIVNGSSLSDRTQTVSVDGSAIEEGSLILLGGFGNDTLIGGDGADRIEGGEGIDRLTGGGGADTFRYATQYDSTSQFPDQILDFASGVDRIDLSAIDADVFAAGNQAFHWIGSNAFTGTGAASAGELRAYEHQGSWFVEGDMDGNGAADLVIQLTAPVTPVLEADFLF